MARESSGRLSLSSSTQRRSMRQPSRHKRDLHAVSCGLNRVRKTLNASNVSFAERERSGTARKRGGLTMTASGSTYSELARSPSSSLMSRQSGRLGRPAAAPSGTSDAAPTRLKTRGSRPGARRRGHAPRGPGPVPGGGFRNGFARLACTAQPPCFMRTASLRRTQHLAARRVPVTARGDLT